MRLYRAMSQEELNKTSQNSLSYNQKWKWFTPSFRFLIKRILNKSFNPKGNYDFVMAISTEESEKFQKINKKEYMLNQSEELIFDIDWIKDRQQIIQEIL